MLRALQRCQYPACHALTRETYCPAHAAQKKAEAEQREAERQKQYDKERRNMDSAAFYRSKAWKHKSKEILERDNHICMKCYRERGIIHEANIAHHIQPLAEHPELALTDSNLEAINRACHGRYERAITNKKR